MNIFQELSGEKGNKPGRFSPSPAGPGREPPLPSEPWQPHSVNSRSLTASKPLNGQPDWIPWQPKPGPERVMPTGGQVEPSAQLKAGRFLTNVATGSIRR
jgi:hypothetical protein